MYPRPRARGSRPLVVPAPFELASEVADVRRAYGADPVAVVTGSQEWRRMRRVEGFGDHAQFWPGGEETFCRVPVIVTHRAETPRVIASQADLENLLLGAGE